MQTAQVLCATREWANANKYLGEQTVLPDAGPSVKLSRL